VLIDDMTSSLWNTEQLRPVAETPGGSVDVQVLGAGYLPLIVVQATISYHRPGRKARQGLVVVEL
jgi:hypothetical protein